MYEVRIISIEERDELLERYGERVLFQRKADINGVCIKLLTDNKAFKEMWEDNFRFMSEDVRPHGRVFALEREGEFEVLYEPLSKTAILFNCDYYGWVKSVALAVAGDFFEDCHSAKRRFSVHGAALDFGGVGVTIIGPPGTGKTTLSMGLLLSERRARLVSDDWYFVFPVGEFFEASASEKECYIRGDVGEIWPEFRSLIRGIPLDRRGRAVADISKLIGGRVIRQTTIRGAVLLARDPSLPPGLRDLSLSEAMEYLAAHDFCNPHQLVRDARKRKLREEFFRKFLSKLEIKLLNTTSSPSESLESAREFIRKLA